MKTKLLIFFVLTIFCQSLFCQNDCKTFKKENLQEYLTKGNSAGALCFLSKDNLSTTFALKYDNKDYNIAPIHIASMFGYLDIVKGIVALDKGQISLVSSYEDRTAIHFASFYGKTDVVKYLLEMGDQVDRVNKHKATALILASINGHLDLVKFLVEKGANIEAKNRFDYTSLMWASKNGFDDIAKFLLFKGADKSVKNKDGQSVCDVAKNAQIKATLKC